MVASRDDAWLGHWRMRLRRVRAPRLYLIVLSLLPPASVSANLLLTADPASVPGNRYVTAAHVRVDEPVNGDVLAAGADVQIDSRVGGDIMAAGGRVDMRAVVAGDVRVAGGQVVVDGKIGGELMAAGGYLTVSARTVVAGRARLAGAHIDLAGQIRGPLEVAADTVRLAGVVMGDVEITAQRVEVASGAQIDGQLRYRSPGVAHIDPGAHVAGGVEHLMLPSAEMGSVLRTGTSVARILLFLGVVLLGVVTLRLLPRMSLGAARLTVAEPLKSLLVGFALLVAAPMAALLLMVSIIGAPLAFVLLALYAVGLLLAWVSAALALGDLGARAVGRSWPHHLLWLAFVGGLLMLWLLGYVPIVGGVAQFIALLLGFGAWSVYLYRWFGGRATPALGAS